MMKDDIDVKYVLGSKTTPFGVAAYDRQSTSKHQPGKHVARSVSEGTSPKRQRGNQPKA